MKNYLLISFIFLLNCFVKIDCSYSYPDGYYGDDILEHEAREYCLGDQITLQDGTIVVVIKKEEPTYSGSRGIFPLIDCEKNNFQTLLIAVYSQERFYLNPFLVPQKVPSLLQYYLRCRTLTKQKDPMPTTPCSCPTQNSSNLDCSFREKTLSDSFLEGNSSTTSVGSINRIMDRSMTFDRFCHTNRR